MRLKATHQLKHCNELLHHSASQCKLLASQEIYKTVQ